MGAREKGLELAVLVDEDVPARMIAYLGRLRQLLLNLPSNALKFTERGEVLLQWGSPKPAPVRSCASACRTRASASPRTASTA